MIPNARAMMAVSAISIAACGSVRPSADAVAPVPEAAADEVPDAAPADRDAADPPSPEPEPPPCDMAAECRTMAADALDREDRAAALALLGRACDLWSAAGCLEAGRLLSGGGATVEDRAAGFDLFDRACGAGSVEGCAVAAKMLSGGDGVPADLPRAIRLTDRACELGDSASCYRVGTAHLTGEGAPRDDDLARAALDKACAGGEVIACAVLEEMDSQAAAIEGGYPLRLEIESLTVEGTTVRDLVCGLREGGLLAAVEIVAGLAAQRDALDRCARRGGAVRVEWAFSEGRTTSASAVAASSRKTARCVERAVLESIVSLEGECSAVILLGDEDGALEALDEMGGDDPSEP